MSVIDTERVRADYLPSVKRANWPAYIFRDIRALCDEVDRLRAALEAASAHAVEASDYADRYKAENDRLRAENDALAAALEDIAGMWQRPDGAWVAMAECSHMTAFTCIEKHHDDPGEWCPVCVAEVAWCAWKMGVLT